MIRVFLDGNVLFSASNDGSNIARLVHLLIEQGVVHFVLEYGPPPKA